ncbi:hypothetical protein KM043_014294 [Ampulex compressa]|nr:hypothetical protein KM043_014294 [Ampulex compressa]
MTPIGASEEEPREENEENTVARYTKATAENFVKHSPTRTKSTWSSHLWKSDNEGKKTNFETTKSPSSHLTTLGPNTKPTKSSVRTEGHEGKARDTNEVGAATTVISKDKDEPNADKRDPRASFLKRDAGLGRPTSGQRNRGHVAPSRWTLEETRGGN